MPGTPASARPSDLMTMSSCPMQLVDEQPDAMLRQPDHDDELLVRHALEVAALEPEQLLEARQRQRLPAQRHHLAPLDRAHVRAA